MALIPYLNFEGNCKDALAFYEQVFGNKASDLMLFKDLPPGDDSIPQGAEEMVMHAQLEACGTVLMFSDVPHGMPFVVGDNITILISIDDQAILKQYFESLSLGGTVTMPLQETFWSKSYGALTDQFGVHWQFNLDEES